MGDFIRISNLDPFANASSGAVISRLSTSFSEEELKKSQKRQDRALRFNNEMRAAARGDTVTSTGLYLKRVKPRDTNDAVLTYALLGTWVSAIQDQQASDLNNDGILDSLQLVTTFKLAKPETNAHARALEAEFAAAQQGNLSAKEWQALYDKAAQNGDPKTAVSKDDVASAAQEKGFLIDATETIVKEVPTVPAAQAMNSFSTMFKASAANSNSAQSAAPSAEALRRAREAVMHAAPELKAA